MGFGLLGLGIKGFGAGLRSFGAGLQCFFVLGFKVLPNWGTQKLTRFPCAGLRCFNAWLQRFGTFLLKPSITQILGHKHKVAL